MLNLNEWLLPALWAAFISLTGRLIKGGMTCSNSLLHLTSHIIQESIAIKNILVWTVSCSERQSEWGCYYTNHHYFKFLGFLPARPCRSDNCWHELRKKKHFQKSGIFQWTLLTFFVSDLSCWVFNQKNSSMQIWISRVFSDEIHCEENRIFEL